MRVIVAGSRDIEDAALVAAEADHAAQTCREVADGLPDPAAEFAEDAEFGLSLFTETAGLSIDDVAAGMARLAGLGFRATYLDGPP